MHFLGIATSYIILPPPKISVGCGPGLRHLFTRKFLPLMGKPCIEELDIAFFHATTYRIGPP